MSTDQECLPQKLEDGKLKKTAIKIATQLDTIITSSAKDLPIAKLYQVVKIGVTIANGLNNYRSDKLKQMMQVIIVKLLKIFNVYFFILRVKILAAKAQAEYGNDPKRKKHLQNIYKLDMREVDNVLNEFNELNDTNPPSSFFSKTDPDNISRKFSETTERLTRVVNDSLNHLTTLLGVTKYVSGLKYEESDEFDAMNSPIKSEHCGNMDFVQIFEHLSEKIAVLNKELFENKTLAEEFLNEKKRDEKLSNDLCASNEKLVYMDPWGTGTGVPTCVKKNQQDMATSQPAKFTPAPSNSSNSTPSSSPNSTPSTPPPKKTFYESIFGSKSKSKSKYLKYKQKYLEITNNSANIHK